MIEEPVSVEGRITAEGVRLQPSPNRTSYFAFEFQSEQKTPDSEYHSGASGCRLCCSEGNTHQGGRRRQGNISRRQEWLRKCGDPSAWRQHHNALCAYVSVRQEGRHQPAGRPGANDWLCRKDRARNSKPLALRVSVKRRSPQSANGKFAAGRSD